MASIRERNGKFNVIYSYTNEKGERKQKWETYETKAEAKRRKKEIEYKKEMGSFVVRKCKTLDELITEYVALYGKENWALSTYEGNVSLINNYILPIIGDAKLSEINTRFIERYYQSLLKRRAVINPLNLSFSCSLRLGELLGLTWDCVDISPEAIEENRAYVFINKESQRIRKESLNALDSQQLSASGRKVLDPQAQLLLP